MKLLLFPLAILFIVTIMSASGLGQNWSIDELDLEEGIVDSGAWFDVKGHKACYENGTAFDEAGTFSNITTFGGVREFHWDNASGSFVVAQMYQSGTTGMQGLNLSQTFGLILIISGAIAAGVVGGIKVFGSGEGDYSIKLAVVGFTLLTIWGVMSAVSYGLLSSIPLLGGIGYLTLTFMYVVGIIQILGTGN